MVRSGVKEIALSNISIGTLRKERNKVHFTNFEILYMNTGSQINLQPLI